MSEKIYSFLLRLYPARFRRQYGAEALQSTGLKSAKPCLHLWRFTT
jgi:hypothetical protein